MMSLVPTADSGHAELAAVQLAAHAPAPTTDSDGWAVASEHGFHWHSGLVLVFMYANVCACACMHACMHACKRVIAVYANVCACACMYAHVHACMHVSVYACVCASPTTMSLTTRTHAGPNANAPGHGAFPIMQDLKTGLTILMDGSVYKVRERERNIQCMLTPFTVLYNACSPPLRTKEERLI